MNEETNTPINGDPIFFKDSRFEMSLAGRFLVRVIASASYGIIAASAIAFSLSDRVFLQGVGWTLGLFLLDRVFHIGASRKLLSEFRLVVGERINAADYFTPHTARILLSAYARASFLKEHLPLVLLEAVLKERDVIRALVRLDIEPERMEEKIKEAIKTAEKQHTPEKIQGEVAAVGCAALTSAIESGSRAIFPRHLFGSLANLKDSAFEAILARYDVVPEDLQFAMLFGAVSAQTTGRMSRANKVHERTVRERTMNRAWTARPTPVLDRFADDLTSLAHASEVGFLIGHAREYDAMVDVISRPGNPNALLVGDSGAGKEAIVEHLAFQIVKDRVPAPLFDRRLVSLSLSRLTSGAEGAELAKRVEQIIDEIIQAGNIILYIPEIHNLVKSGNALQLSLADMLIPALRSSSFAVIGATFPRLTSRFRRRSAMILARVAGCSEFSRSFTGPVCSICAATPTFPNISICAEKLSFAITLDGISSAGVSVVASSSSRRRHVQPLRKAVRVLPTPRSTAAR